MIAPGPYTRPVDRGGMSLHQSPASVLHASSDLHCSAKCPPNQYTEQVFGRRPAIPVSCQYCRSYSFGLGEPSTPG